MGGHRRQAAAVLLALAPVVPVVASAVHVGRRWTPTGDTAIIAIRARDVFGGGPLPLLGQPSTAGATVGEQVHHPGPLEHWAIGLGQQVVDHPATSLVVVALVAVAATLATSWWLWRLGGIAALAVGAPVLTALAWSLRGEVLVDPFNPFVALLPLVTFAIALAAAGLGHRWALATAVVAGSWSAQAHLTTFGLVAALSLGAATAAVVRLAGHRSGGGADLRRWTRPAAVAAALLVGCWVGPLVDAASNGGGNLVALTSAGGAVEPVDGGLAASVDDTAATLGWRPAFLHPSLDLGARLADADPWATATAALVVLAAAGVSAATVRHQPAIVAVAGAAALLLATGTVLLARLPASFFAVFAPGNHLWRWPVGALLWGAVAAGLVTLAGRRPGLRRVAPQAVAAAVVAATALAAHAVLDPSARPVRRAEIAQAAALAPAVLEGLDREGTYGFDLPAALDEQAAATGVLHDLVRHGVDVRVPRSFAPSFGVDRASGLAGTDGTLVLRIDGVPDEGVGVLLATYRPPAALLDELASAERAVVRRIQAAGGTAAVAEPEVGLAAREPADLAADGFAGLAVGGFLRDEVTAWPETRRLVELSTGPVRPATVHLLPPSG